MFSALYNSICHLLSAVEITTETIELAALAANKSIRNEFQLPDIEEEN